MTTDFAVALADEIVQRLDAATVLETIDFHADKVQEAGGTLKAFCPIHQDSRFRSLLIDAERRAFRCTIKTCRGYGGGSLLELYALSRDVPVLKAACELVDNLQLDLGPDWKSQLAESYLGEAAAAIERGDLTEAETLLREILSITPDLPDGRIMLASVMADLGNPQAAAEEYIRLIDRFLTDGRVEDAAAAAEDARKRFADNEDLLFIRVKVAEAKGDSELAIARMREIVELRESTNRQLDNVGLLEQIVAKVPDEPEFALKLAGLYEQQHNLRGASRQYENAAMQLLKTGEAARGIELLEKVLQYNSENTRARLELANHLAKAGELDKARSHTFRVANQQIDQQEFGLAIATINKWLEREPDNIESSEMLARVYQDQGRPSEAAAQLINGAEVASRIGNHSRAADLLLRAKFVIPDDVELRRRLIAEFQATNEQQRAAFEILDLAEILFSMDNKTAAVELLTENAGLEISLQLKLQMISSLASHAEKDAALAVLNAALEEISPETALDEVAELKGMLATLEPDNVAYQLEHIQAMWQSSPERGAEAAADAVDRYLANGRVFEAGQILETVSELLKQYVPETARLLALAERCERFDLAGNIYQVSIQGFAEQDAEAALACARRIAEIDPGHQSAPSDIAYLLSALGRTEEAANQYAAVAELLRLSGDLENSLQYAREAAALNENNVSSLSTQALVSQQLLTREETAALGEQLLVATRQSSNAVEIARGYLAYSEIYPNDLDILIEATERLEAIGANEGLARLQARRAAQLFSSGNLAEARALLERAVQIAPELPDILDQYGQTALAQGEVDSGAGALANAACAYKSYGYIEDAMRCASQAYEAGPESLETWEMLFRGAEAAELYPIAIRCCEKLTYSYLETEPASSAARWAREWVRLAPETPQAYEALARALLSVDQKDSASKAFSQSARLFHQAGNYERAISVLKAAADADLFSDGDHELVSLIEAAVDDENVRKLAQVLGVVTEIGRNNISGARAIADRLDGTLEAAQAWGKIAKAQEATDDAQDANLKAAQIYAQHERNDAAIAELQTAVALGPPAYKTKHLLARLLDKADRHEDALPWQLAVVSRLVDEKSDELEPLLAHLRRVHADSVDSRLRLGQTLAAAGLGAEALKDLEAAAELATITNNAAALISICSVDEKLTRQSLVLTRARADSLMGMENAEQALDWLRSAGRELLSQGKSTEAIEMAQKWISLAPSDPEAYRLYADSCDAAGDDSCAMEARLSLVRLTLEGGNLSQALQEIQPLVDVESPQTAAIDLKIRIQKVLQDTEGAAESLVLLGDAFAQAGDDENALRAYKESVSLQPNSIQALQRHAETTRRVHGVNAALPLYRQWITVARSTVPAAQVVTMLEEVLTFAPDSVQALRDLTNLLIEQGRSGEAMPHLSHLALVLESEGDYTGAAQTLESIGSHAATADAEHFVTIAGLYERANSVSSALEHLRHAARLFFEADKPADAAKLYDRILRISADAALPEDFAAAAKASAFSGDLITAESQIGRALSGISRVSGNRSRREALLAQALDIAPLNVEYILQHMELLPQNRAMTEGLRKARELNSTGRADDAIRVLSQVVLLAPHDMSIRQELFAPLRQTGNISKLRQELLSFAADAVAAGDTDAAVEALDEAATLAETPAHYRALAELNERIRRTDEAAVCFTAAAVKFAEDGKIEPAVANINRAVSAKPSAVPAENMAQLVQLVGEPVLDVAREQLRSALTARRQKQSQVLALALLETVQAERRIDILKTVESLGGSTFAVGISQRWTQHLLDMRDMTGALQHAGALVEISPDSPDAWHLAAKVYLAVGMPADARRCAVEAARLFQTASAVIEEEDSYRLALEAEPDDLGVQAALAEYLAREQRQDEAIRLLQQMIKTAEATGNSDMLLEYLNRAVQVAPANPDLREKLAAVLENIAPDSAIENWMEAGRLYMAQEELERAVRIYRHVLKLNPANEAALQCLLTQAEQTGDLVSGAKYTSSLASVKASRKNVGEAVRLLQNYLARDSDNVEILEQLASLAGTSNNAEVFAATTGALAQKHQKSGNYVEAIHHYELLLERDPKDTRILMSLLDCSAAAGLQEKGQTYARHLLTLARETEDPERVRFAATTILNYDDSDPVVHNDLGEALLSLNRVQEAVAEWMRAAELFEGNANTAAAYTCYRRVSQVNPGTLQAWKRMSELAVTIGDIESARIALMHVLEMTADRKEAIKQSALLNKLLQAMPDDQQMHTTALQFHKNVGETQKAAQEYVWLVRKALELGQEHQAEELLNEAVEFAPDDELVKTVRYEIIRKMGRLEELQLRLRNEAEQFETAGDIAQAVRVVQELVASAPGQIAVHRDLARLLEAAGRFDEALGQQLEVVRLQLQKGELEEAREIADDLAEKHKKDSRARERIAEVFINSPFPDAAARHYMAAAKIAESTKDNDRAIELYENAAQARPAWSDARRAVANAYEKANRPDDAFKAWLALTSILLDEGDFAEATATLDRLAELRPDSPDVRIQLAELYEKTGNRSRQADVLQEVATLYEAAGQEKEALEMYRKLASIQSEDPAILTRYVELLTQHGANSADLAEEFTRLADLLARRGDHEAALQTYEQVLGVNPESTAVRSRYAAFLLGRGSRNRALMEMRALANLYMERGEPAAAVEVYNAALTISPRDADLCLALATAQEAAGFTEDARVSYARASAILASTAAVKGIDTYRRILTQDENNTAVRLRLVELLLNSGDKNEAAREARTLAELHVSRGELVEAEKAYRLVDQCEPESIDDIKAAIRRESYDPSLQYIHYVRLGNVYYKCGDIDNALDAYRTARSLHDDQPEIIQKCIDCVSLVAPEAEAIPDYLLMAEKLMLAGDMHHARQVYEKVRLIDPFNNDAKCGLEAVNAADRARSAKSPGNDDMILKAARTVSKRVALRDLISACQQAAEDPKASDSQRLGGS